jgi:DNA ligase-1
MASVLQLRRIWEMGMKRSRTTGGTAAIPMLLAGCMLCNSVVVTAAEPPPLALANDYERDVDPSQFWVSEKYDGMRAYWDGATLLTRNGHTLHAPQWFTADWPNVPLDGELWAGRGRFEVVTATVRDQQPDDAAWRQIRFMVFDLPAHGGSFGARLSALRSLLAGKTAEWLRRAPQFRVASQGELDLRLREVVAGGGEGLMLHRDDSLYRAERNDDLLKLKPYQDGEAQVIAHLPGNGKYQGMLGALEVRTAGGVQFRIGTGFSDEQRRHPPPIGSWVTYSYHSLTARGIPRSARFLRTRDDE